MISVIKLVQSAKPRLTQNGGGFSAQSVTLLNQVTRANHWQALLVSLNRFAVFRFWKLNIDFPSIATLLSATKRQGF
jgi:hypothetical protein